MRESDLANEKSSSFDKPVAVRTSIIHKEKNYFEGAKFLLSQRRN